MKRILLFLCCTWALVGGTITQWNVNGHDYEVVAAPGGITWSDASTGATALGGYLATITSAGENDFVFGLVDDPAFYVQGQSPGGLLRALGPWIGGYRPSPGPSSSGFAWVSGETFSYSDWASGEPSNTNSDENNIQFIYKCASGAPSCTTPLAPTWNDLASGADTYYHELPVAYVVEFDSAPVPEPGSLALVLGGFAVFWWVYRRRGTYAEAPACAFRRPRQ